MQRSRSLFFSAFSKGVVTKVLGTEGMTAINPKASMVTCTPYQGSRLLNVLQTSPAPDAPINIKVRINADLSREAVRGVCMLPHGVPSKTRIAVFCADDLADEMIAAGADIAGITLLTKMINDNRIEFDRMITTPENMVHLAKLARVLGPLRLMPSQKSNTIVVDLKEAIRLVKSGVQVEFRAETDGTMNVTVGTSGFTQTELLENVKAFAKELIAARPRSGNVNASQEKSEFQWPIPFKKVTRRAPHSTIWDVEAKLNELQQRKKDRGSARVTQVSKAQRMAEKNKEFIGEAAFLLPGLPPIFLEPNALNPNSTGYFR